MQTQIQNKYLTSSVVLISRTLDIDLADFVLHSPHCAKEKRISRLQLPRSSLIPAITTDMSTRGLETADLNKIDRFVSPRFIFSFIW